MGLKDALAIWWPLGVLLTVLGGVSIAFTRCAIAEAVVRLAARLYAASSAECARWREEWLRNIEDLHPAQRPAHAGSLLWVGVREATLRRLARRSDEPALRTEGDLIERYNGWLKQLSSDDGAVRVAGIRALRTFALDPAAQTDRIDWRMVLGTLAALARNLSRGTETQTHVASISTADEHQPGSGRVVGVIEAVRVLGRFPQLSGRWATLEHDLTDVALATAELSRLDLPRVDLRRADLRGANMRHANLRSANLADADLSGGDLRGAHLRSACLRGACLRHANLRYVRLRGADLSHADLRDADLTGVSFRGVTLRGADLRGADLTTANLLSVDPVRLDRRVADLPHAWLASVLYDENTLWPSGFDAPLPSGDTSRP